MQLKLKLFASLTEYLPATSEGNTVNLVLATSESCNALIKRYNIPFESVQVVMVNGEFMPLEHRDAALKEGDTVSIWPAIQGG